jgi:hypothetical protein
MRWLVPLVCLSLAACVAPLDVAGLRPLSPEPYNLAPKMDSLQPTLRWEPFPRPTDLQADRAGWVSRVRRVTYDLRIWRGVRDQYGYLEVYPAELVYSRSALAATEHLVEVPLASDTQYLWSVRARFDLDGQSRVTPWGVLLLPGQSPADDPRSGSVPPRGYYRFATP